MIYTIKNPQDKEWNGKRFVEATLIDEKGEEFKVSAWNGEYTDENGVFKPTIDVELFKNEKGYWAISRPKVAAGANFKAMQTEKIIARKEEGIAKFQDSKEQSIKIASTMNKAIELAIAEYANPKSLDTLEELITKWRKWIWLNWDKTDQYPPF